MFISKNGSLFVGAAQRFSGMRTDIVEALLKTPLIRPDRWQTLDVRGSVAHSTHELLNVSIWYDMPQYSFPAQNWIEPDLPWAEAHFQERVGGEPINPGVEHANWPYHAGSIDLHQHGGKYDHNYMERFWASKLTRDAGFGEHPFFGYRFRVGDLGDVVKQLRRDPTTRQAYLPVWFPEDTGATSGQRVPCTLGYHFIVRGDALHVSYSIRSCEIYRHFTNDVYMAVRLGHWVRDQVNKTLDMGQLTMNVTSLHAFKGDVEKIKEKML